MINHFPYISRNGVKIGEAFKKYIDFLKAFPDTSLALSASRQLSEEPTAIMRVSRDPDEPARDFSAKEVANGTLLDYVVPTDVQALYDNAIFLNETNNDEVIQTDYSTQIDDFTIIADIIPFSDVGKCIVAKDSSASRGFMFRVNSGTLQLEVNGGSIGGISNITIDKTVLQRVAIKFNQSTGAWKMWKMLDGVITSDTGTHTNTLGTNTSANLWIGNRQYNDNDFNGVIRNVKIWDSELGDAETESVLADGTPSTTPLYDPIGDGNLAANWANRTGTATLNVTINNSPALFTGQGFNAYVPIWYDQRVPTSTQRMYFDGVDDYVDTDSLFTEFTTTGEFNLKLKFIKFVDRLSAIFSGREGSSGIFVYALDTGQIRYHIITNSGLIVVNTTTVLNNNQIYDLEFVADGSTMKVIIDGVEDDTTLPYDGTIKSPTTFTYKIGDDGSVSPIIGSVWDIYIADDGAGTNVISSYQGYGNTDADWEDQIGSNDGTVVGSPARYNPDTGAISNDATQTTAGSQPAIVKDGVLNTENGKPTIVSDGVDDKLVLPDGCNVQSVFGVVYFDSASIDFSGWVVFTLDEIEKNNIRKTNTITEQYRRNLSNEFIKSVGGDIFVNSVDTESFTNDELHLATLIKTTSIDTAGASIFETDTDRLFTGKVSEIIIFPTDKSADREKIEGNINRHYKVY